MEEEGEINEKEKKGEKNGSRGGVEWKEEEAREKWKKRER